MATTKLISGILNIFYILICFLFILDVFDIVEAKGSNVKTFIHCGSLLLTPILVLYNLFVQKSTKWSIGIGIIAFSIVLCFCLVISKRGLLGYLFTSESWKTQTVLYENVQFESIRVEFQMQDVGALGYNERFVSVIYITNWFMITDEIDPNKIFGKEWVKVDKEINELGIVY